MIVLRERVWECLRVCVTLSAVACLRGGSFLDTFLVLSKHIVCEWLPVIASLELCLLPQSRHCCCFSIALPLSLPLTPASPPLSFLSPPHPLSLSHFLLLFQSVYPDIRVLRLVVSLICLFYFIFPEGIQPWNNLCRSSWNSCQAWLQLPFVRHVTTGSRGCADDDRSTGSLPLRGPCILPP